MAKASNGNGTKWLTVCISLFVIAAGSGGLAWNVLRGETHDNRQTIREVESRVDQNETDVAVIKATVTRIDKNVEALLER